MPHDGHGPKDHAHGGLSASGHPFRSDQDHPLTYWQTMEIAVRELLVEKGVATAAEIAEEIQKMDARGVALGARVVAKAWSDPDYKVRLLADGSAACREIGIEVDALKLVVLENTESAHNLVVCTLCSCYPRTLLGPPPDWYKQRAYRTRAVREPRRVLAEFGVALEDGVRVQTHDSTADMRYVVLPRRPEGADGWSEDQLATLVTRDSLIGVGLARQPGN